MKFLFILIPTLIFQAIVLAKNPIIPNKGANDPHIRIFNGKAYLSASHDKSIDNRSFSMDDWWIWSSDNLVDWKLESILKPEDTYIGKPFSSCWATDIATRHGKYYWYFSEGNHQSGVVVGDSPAGPWKNPLGKPLLSSEMTPTHEYDMGIIQDVAGDFYIVFGVWDYYIAKLNKDMISLAEKPRKIEIKDPRGPYNPDGKNLEKPTDDKPFIHSYKGKYYLSWGCFYAMADNVYGPYNYTGSIIDASSFAPGYEKPTWPNGFLQGRHGSFFEFHHQWYFAYCDISQTGNRYFRDTFISYVHYKENGEMALIRVDGIGVGEYDANHGKIEAEDYFKASGVTKKMNADSGFSVSDIDGGDFLVYQKIQGLEHKSKIELKIHKVKNATIELRSGSPKGKLIASFKLEKDSDITQFELPSLQGVQDWCFVFRGQGDDLLQFDSFSVM
jgi:arabinoxylan arabinofuranohydrolase